MCRYDFWCILLNEKSRVQNSMSTMLLLSKKGKYLFTCICLFLKTGKMNQTLVKMVIYKGMGDRVKGREIEARLDFSQGTLFCRFELRTMHMF